MSQNYRPARSLARWVGTTGVVLMVAAGCVTAGSNAGTSASPGAPTPTPAAPTPAPTTPAPTPTGNSSANGFYLRAWQTQALAPQYTFSWLPIATISNGRYVDGVVAVPAIYPGPLWVGPSVQPISAAGIDALVAEARKDGLLGTKTDFSGAPMPGSITGHLQLVVDGKTYDLTGSPNAAGQTSASPAPGTPEAFAAFWQRLTGLGMWLADDLGPSAPYEPDRLAVLALPPTAATNGVTPNEVPWPLATPFSKFGTAMGNETFRCAVVAGADLALLEPVVKQSNQLTRFVDSVKVKDTLTVRVMVPGEPNPCQ